MSGEAPDREFWRQRYREGHTPWDLGEPSPPVRRLAAHFPSGATVIVPGCGRGHEAVYLAERGHEVAALDIADEAVQAVRDRAAARGVTVHAVRADLFRLPGVFNERFDVWLEQTCFCAVHPDTWPDYEATAYRALKPGGLLAGVFMEVPGDDGPPWNVTPDTIRNVFGDERRWALEGLDEQPHNPARPGPEFTVRLRRV